MPTVYFEAENRKVEVPEGTTLRKAAMKAGVSVYGSVNKILNCRGFGLCGTDRVLASPQECINAQTFFEKLSVGENAKVRLACQTKISGDIVVNTAPAMEYGIEMLDNVKFGLLAGFFGLLTLIAVVFMVFEMVGKPLF
jgi:ferredoxin